MFVFLKQWYRESEAFLVVFSMNDKHSWENVANYVSKISSEVKDDRIPVVVVGNKSDLQKQGKFLEKERKRREK